MVELGPKLAERVARRYLTLQGTNVEETTRRIVARFLGHAEVQAQQAQVEKQQGPQGDLLAPT
jgi:hypothetical protein